MKIFIKLFLALSIITGLNMMISGCYYYVEEELYPNPLSACDTTAVSYSNDIVQILETNCYSCHTADAAPLSGAGVVLDAHPQVLPYADNGKLICTIEFAAGCSVMPPSGAQLSACNLALINSWVNDGAPNN